MAPCVRPCLRGRLRGGEADSVEVEDILEVDLAVAVKSIIGGGTAATGTTTATAAEGGPSPPIDSPIEPPRDAICSFCRASRKNASLEVSTSPLSSPPLAPLAPNKEDDDNEEEDDEEGVDCRAPPCCPPH